MNGIIGPNPCMECGGTYGKHTKLCRVERDREQAEKKADVAAGKKLLEAIAKGDAQAVGRALREHN